MFDKFDSYTFFPAQHWSHAWERQHELIYRLASVIGDKVHVFPPLGLVEYRIFSITFVNKVVNKLRKEKSFNNSNRKLDNMEFIHSLYIHKFDKLSTSINYHLLNSKFQLGQNNFFWATYINPVNYKFFKKSKFKVLDLAERRQVNDQLSDKMKELEKQAVAEADIVFVDNLVTLEDYKDLNSNIKYVPQGYDSQKIFLNTVKKGNKIGYIGHLHKHIDYDYLFKLIEENSDCEFLIVGGILDNKALKLNEYKNVVLTGQVPKDELQQYLEQMDYGLIPYKVNQFTEGVFPTKLFEYLGAGVPVISTPIPEVVNYRNDKYIFIEKTPKVIEYNVCLDGIEDFLKHHTWESRFNEYVESIKEVLV
ncbi:glycosyl transferase family 1 [Bacillus pseudomycoides]|nr:glycosyl transferase family 1 [Bacillus pseudomycoides]